MDILNYLKEWNNYYKGITRQTSFKTFKERLNDEQYYDFLCALINDIEKKQLQEKIENVEKKEDLCDEVKDFYKDNLKMDHLEKRLDDFMEVVNYPALRDDINGLRDAVIILQSKITGDLS